ncbi:bacterioferritin-associated ferredoxin [Bradyrhizobium sp. BR 10261]|uniref:(2Fe-2S)-binding protein n=1 Tax=Bradyrhizobium sp. BR 10261 TaxID=2749992 RepID=UPI001C650B36|nr:(2Fe-2S)-binding protein [Bradyrhizobium sp. BR 10261]MBW7965662.1 (2Fe-2S)-binding protein [Bradyrhizobium sp. BR 10261]
MIVCSCNIISDHDIRDAVVATDDALFSPAQVYDCLGCTVRCGRCSQSVRRIIDELPPRDRRCTKHPNSLPASSSPRAIFT